MKNLQIGDNDLIGNKFNGHDLHINLNKIGIKSSHLIANHPESNDKDTFQIGNKFSNHIREIIKDFESTYSIISGSHVLPYDIIFNRLFLEADVVHMHLINNYMFNVNLLPLFSSLKPLVWTLHDPWALTGHCVHPFDCEKWLTGCGDCPDLEAHFKIKADTTALNWEMKRLAFQSSQLNLIVASKWMQDLVKNSPIFNINNCEVNLIPFGVDQNIFKPSSIRDAKSSIGVNFESTVIFFRSEDSKYKGREIIIEALLGLEENKNITLVTVGQSGLIGDLKSKFKTLEFGWISDDKRLAEIYQACDIFLMPSKAEAFGMMAIEAMSCGKPVIALEGTALPDIIKSPEIGIACKRNSGALRNEIKKLIENRGERELRGMAALEFAKKEYNVETYVDRVVKVYNKSISSHKPSIYRDRIIKQLLKYPVGLNDNKGKIQTNFQKGILYVFGIIPIVTILSGADLFKIKLFNSRFSIFKIKKQSRRTRYYLFGILVLKFKISNI